MWVWVNEKEINYYQTNNSPKERIENISFKQKNKNKNKKNSRMFFFISLLTNYFEKKKKKKCEGEYEVCDWMNCSLHYEIILHHGKIKNKNKK